MKQSAKLKTEVKQLKARDKLQSQSMPDGTCADKPNDDHRKQESRLTQEEPVVDYDFEGGNKLNHQSVAEGINVAHLATNNSIVFEQEHESLLDKQEEQQPTAELTSDSIEIMNRPSELAKLQKSPLDNPNQHADQNGHLDSKPG